MFYLSAFLAIAGTISYHFLLKLVPGSLNPMVSVLGIYAAALSLGLVLLPLFGTQGGVAQQIRQLSWVQIALALSVLMIELGFLLMYRHGWRLSTGNVVTGVVINMGLAGLGVTLFREQLSNANAVGVALCVVGVALLSLRS